MHLISRWSPLNHDNLVSLCRDTTTTNEASPPCCHSLPGLHLREGETPCWEKGSTFSSQYPDFSSLILSIVSVGNISTLCIITHLPIKTLLFVLGKWVQGKIKKQAEIACDLSSLCNPRVLLSSDNVTIQVILTLRTKKLSLRWFFKTFVWVACLRSSWMDGVKFSYLSISYRSWFLFVAELSLSQLWFCCEEDQSWRIVSDLASLRWDIKCWEILNLFFILTDDPLVCWWTWWSSLSPSSSWSIWFCRSEEWCQTTTWSFLSPGKFLSKNGTFE